MAHDGNDEKEHKEEEEPLPGSTDSHADGERNNTNHCICQHYSSANHDKNDDVPLQVSLDPCDRSWFDFLIGASDQFDSVILRQYGSV